MKHHPPSASRFRKGQSGNPKGRPKKAEMKAPSAFDVVIEKTLTVTQSGRPREVTIEEALQHRAYQEAIAGNRSARREVLKMIALREKHRAASQGRAAPKVELFTEEDPDNADAALLILGIASRRPDREGPQFKDEQLLLEPWAVQMALSRRRGGKRLARRDRDDIVRCTRDAGSLRWPRGALDEPDGRG